MTQLARRPVAGTKTVYTFAGTIGPSSAGETYGYRVGNAPDKPSTYGATASRRRIPRRRFRRRIARNR
ncbi:MAG: hypothetical protein MZU84_07315 [Sphingobacterium sp.]|nr:hypothetical protein [Sphingobacterium sp.]